MTDKRRDSLPPWYQYGDAKELFGENYMTWRLASIRMEYVKFYRPFFRSLFADDPSCVAGVHEMPPDGARPACVKCGTYTPRR